MSARRRGLRNGLLATFIVIFICLLTVTNTEVARGANSLERSTQELGNQERLRAEQLLADLGYWTGPIDGKFDAVSRNALITFQKVEGRPRTGKLTWQELKALQGASRPWPRQPEYAHIEIDLTRQVLFIVDDRGLVTRILPVSTGNEKLYVDRGRTHRAHTPKGTFTVFKKVNGWRLSSLGLLYYPSYILNGIAIHGSLFVPPFPDSHGCIRIPMFAAKEVSSQLPMGTKVIIYVGDQNSVRGL